MEDINLTDDCTLDRWVYVPNEALRIKTTSTSATSTTKRATPFLLLSKSYPYSSSEALSHQPVPNPYLLQRSLTLAKPDRGSFNKIFKHFWTCVKPRVSDDSNPRPTAASKQKQGGSTKRRSTTPVQSPQRVPRSPSYAIMSPEERDECIKEAILYCNKQSGKPLD